VTTPHNRVYICRLYVHTLLLWTEITHTIYIATASQITMASWQQKSIHCNKLTAPLNHYIRHTTMPPLYSPPESHLATWLSIEPDHPTLNGVARRKPAVLLFAAVSTPRG